MFNFICISKIFIQIHKTIPIYMMKSEGKLGDGMKLVGEEEKLRTWRLNMGKVCDVFERNCLCETIQDTMHIYQQTFFLKEGSISLNSTIFKDLIFLLSVPIASENTKDDPVFPLNSILPQTLFHLVIFILSTASFVSVFYYMKNQHLQILCFCFCHANYLTTEIQRKQLVLVQQIRTSP